MVYYRMSSAFVVSNACPKISGGGTGACSLAVSNVEILLTSSWNACQGGICTFNLRIARARAFHFRC